jgi:hypothetical protein
MVGGGGLVAFAALDEEGICARLTRPMLRRALLATPSTSSGSAFASPFDSELLGGLGGVQRGMGGFGAPDCVVVTSGRMFAAHQLVLAGRSAELRDVLAMESNGGTGDAPVHILLPELGTESAMALLHFLYCDTLPASALGVEGGEDGRQGDEGSTLRALSRVSRYLRLPRLQLLAESALRLMNGMDAERDAFDAEGNGIDGEAGGGV